MKSVYRQEAIK